MKIFVEKAEMVASPNRHIFKSERRPIYSFGNAPIHQGANLQPIGIVGARRAPLPPSSPDMHKCIEHVFGTLTRAMNTSLHRDLKLTTAAQYRAELERLFGSVITASSVQKDVDTLKETYIAIKDVVAGDWPDKELR